MMDVILPFRRKPKDEWILESVTIRHSGGNTITYDLAHLRERVPGRFVVEVFPSLADATVTGGQS